MTKRDQQAADYRRDDPMPHVILRYRLPDEQTELSAAMQGVDLDKNSGSGNEWEDMKARVFSKGKTTDGNDILALQGVNAEKAGFGIGMGLDYEVYE
jgi:hypothetical protein